MKFTTVVTKVDFDLDEVRFALADYVDFYHHKPKLAENIRNNKWKCRFRLGSGYSRYIRRKS